MCWGAQTIVVGAMAGGLEDDSAAHFDGVVGEALVEAAQQGDIDGSSDAVFPFVVHEHCEQVPVKVIHRVVISSDLGGLLRICRQQCRLGAVAQIDCQSAHFSEVAVDFFEQHVHWVAAAGDLGDVQGQGAMRSKSAAICRELTIARRSPAHRCLQCYSTNAASLRRARSLR